MSRDIPVSDLEIADKSESDRPVLEVAQTRTLAFTGPE
jgi:hypothetical protein